MCESGDVKGCPSCPPKVKDEILLLASQLPKTRKRKLNGDNIADAHEVALEQSRQQGRQVGIQEAMAAAGKIAVIKLSQICSAKQESPSMSLGSLSASCVCIMFATCWKMRQCSD